MPQLARAERSALADTLLAAGPDAPTLSGSWRTRDLAAHLVVREGRPDAAAGIVVPALAGRTQAAMDQALRTHGYEGLVARLRSGPPAWHPTRLAPLDEMVNLVEMYVHHEDVLRAGPTPAQPRPLDPETSRALEQRLHQLAPALLRRAKGVAVELVGGSRRRRVGGSGLPLVEVHARPEEALLYLFGRKEAAQVELIGEEAAVERLRSARLGL